MAQYHCILPSTTILGSGNNYLEFLKSCHECLNNREFNEDDYDTLYQLIINEEEKEMLQQYKDSLSLEAELIANHPTKTMKEKISLLLEITNKLTLSY